MIALTSPYLWYTTRATGLTTMVLFTIVVTMGTLVANRVGGVKVGRFELNELHRSVSLVALVFLALHVATTVLDSYVKTGVTSVLIPMTSPYKRIPVALGAVALDLMVAVWATSVLKARVAHSTWRFIHWFSWLAFASSIAHALTVGTDAKSGVGLVLVLACAVAGTGSALWRFLGRPTRAAGRTALSPLAAAPARHPVPGAARPKTPVRSGTAARTAPPTTPSAPSGESFPRAPRSSNSKRYR